MKPQELRNKTNEELWQLRKELEYTLVAVKAGKYIKSDKNLGIKNTKKGSKTSLAREVRKNIARINTILRERELSEVNNG